MKPRCKTCDDPIRKSRFNVWIHSDSLLSGCPEGCGSSFSVAEPKGAE